MNYYQHKISDFDKNTKISKLPVVYVLSCPNLEYIKIGMTTNPKKRFSNIQSGCPFKLFLWLGIRTPTPKEVERTLHEKLSVFRTRGEWFKIDADTADSVIDFFNKTNADVRNKRDALL